MRLTPGDAQRFAEMYERERSLAIFEVPWFDIRYVAARWGAR